MTIKHGHALPPSHSFLIEGERVAVADFPGGLVHIVRADDRSKLGCGRSAEVTRDFGEPSPEWLFGWMISSGLICKRCADALEQSLRVYLAAMGDERSEAARPPEAPGLALRMPPR